MFGGGVLGGVHYGAGGAAGCCSHIVLCANTCLLVWTSTRKVATSCRMSVIPAFIDCAFVLLAICIVPITLLMTSVMVLILSSSLSDNYCAFVMVLWTPTPCPEIYRFLYASPKCCFIWSNIDWEV